MCKFFSCISDGRGKIYYIKPEDRKIVYNGGELLGKDGMSCITRRKDLDSHSLIAAFHGLNCDKVNKYEFRPLDRKFTVDQLNVKDDHVAVKRKIMRMNMQDLCPPELILRKIFHPFKGAKRKRATKDDLLLLKKWDSVGSNVGDSVGGSVWGSVWDSVGDSVGDSVWGSVWDSVWDSVGDSVWGYIGSFFNLTKWKYIDHEEGEYPFQPVVDLWERGIVPSFDGKTWRLHGYKGKVIKEITKEELERL